MEESGGDWVYMMDVWTKCTVGDVCSTVSETYRRKSPKVILINTSDVLKGKVLNHNYVDNVNLKGQFKKTFQKYDILFSEIRPANERYAFIDFDDTQDYIASTKLMVIRPMKEKILPLYLYFILKSKNMLSELQSLAETRSGTFPQITFDSELSSMPIMLPNMDIQEKIITILKSIDDKIATNTAINKNLESQAQAIFARYFINIENTPNGWTEGSLTDIAEYLNGLAMQKFRPSNENESLPVLKIKELRQGICDAESDRCSSEIKKAYIVHDGDVIFSWSGSLLVDFWCGGNCGLNQHLFKVTSEKYFSLYMTQLLQNVSKIVNSPPFVTHYFLALCPAKLMWNILKYRLSFSGGK